MNFSKLRVYRLDENSELNKEYPLKGLKYGEHYVVLGEVSSIDHYILACYSFENPRILPGFYHLDDGRFIEVSDDDL